jgi:small-conductance mechanosensitive channel
MHDLMAWLDYFGVSARALFGTIVIIVAALIVASIIGRIGRRMLPWAGLHVELPKSALDIAIRVAIVLIWLCSGLLVLELWGVGVGGLWTVMVSAITAIGVGFLAVWTMISNVTASLFITIWRPFHVGEMVEIVPEGLRGRVSERNLMFTMMRDGDGTVLNVPNNLFFQKMFRVGEAVAGQEKREVAVHDFADAVRGT